MRKGKLMKIRKFILSFAFVLMGAAFVHADQNSQGRVQLLRDETFEQNLRWQSSADKTITPAKVIRWIMGMRGTAVSSKPSQTEFQPIFNTENGHIRIVAAFAYKF